MTITSNNEQNVHIAILYSIVHRLYVQVYNKQP
jgi:hypothetical protein